MKWPLTYDVPLLNLIYCIITMSWFSFLLFCRAMKDLDFQELPPLVYQLLLLSTKVHNSLYLGSYM